MAKTPIKLNEEVLARPVVDPSKCVQHLADLPTLTQIETSLRSGPHVYDAVLRVIATRIHALFCDSLMAHAAADSPPGQIE